MAFTLANSTENTITLTNTSEEDDFVYTIHVLGNNGDFTPVTGNTEEPSTVLDPSTSVNIDLEDDGVYALISSDPDNTYYFYLNYNLRVCERTFIKTILCSGCDACEDLTYVRNVMRFLVLKERFYFIANKYVQDQSVVDLITPDLGELLYWEDILTQLTTICGCNETSQLKQGCGCS